MLKGKTAIITGSNRGIGRAILEEFARQGCDVLACVRTPTTEFEGFLQKLARECGVKAELVRFDLTDSEAMKSAIRGLFTNKREIDILVNCAGTFHVGLFQMTPISKIREVFEVNLFAQMELTQLILKIMARKKSGCIINIASILGIDDYAGQCAYGSSKSALLRWTTTLAAETGNVGIRVNAIAPGLTDTDMSLLMDDKTREKAIGHSALKRIAKPENVAKVVAFLASDAAEFINGSVIRTDGGLVL